MEECDLKFWACLRRRLRRSHLRFGHTHNEGLDALDVAWVEEVEGRLGAQAGGDEIVDDCCVMSDCACEGCVCILCIGIWGALEA